MEKDVQVDGLNIHYEVSGDEDAPALLLMHGWGCNHTTVRSIAQAASITHRVYNVDLPGFGQSSEPTDVWDAFAYATAMKNFMSAVGIENPVLIGHSHGGRVAIAMASTASDNYSKLILVDSAGIRNPLSLAKRMRQRIYKIGKKLINILPTPTASKLIKQWGSLFGSADYASSSQMMRAIMSRCLNQDLREFLPKIKASTLLIWGENDTATPISDARLMEKSIPDAGLVSFSGCGHYSFLDNPVQFRAVLQAFLNS